MGGLHVCPDGQTGSDNFSVIIKPGNVINLSGHILSKDEQQLLSLGLTFIPNPRHDSFDPDDLVADFDSLYSKYIKTYGASLSKQPHSLVSDVCDDIVEHLCTTSSRKIKSNLPNHLRRALSNLRDNKDIIVTKADKGDVCVVMDVDHYLRLAWAHLSDGNTYNVLENDPTQHIVSTFNTYIQQCLQDGVIDKHTFTCLTLPAHTSTQIMYFLPKVHKYPVKVRPIVSCTGGPTHTASAYIDRLLQPHMRRVRSYVKNSTEVINTLSDMTFPDNIYLATLDIASLYTNITHIQAIQAFTRRFRSHPKFVFLLDLLKFVLGNNVFSFDNVVFKQTCGLAMGTKLAPALATIVVGDLEEPFLDRHTHQPLLWMRYIDDVFLVWPHSESDFLAFVDALNNLAPRIKFTYDLSRRAVNFLDLTIYKSSDFSITGKLSTKIYYKPTNTFSYNHGSTFIPNYVLKGIAIGEAVRILRNTDSKCIFYKYRSRLISHLVRRGFSRRITDHISRIGFDQRENFLTCAVGKKNIDKPLPLNTLFYLHTPSLRSTLSTLWPRIYQHPHTSLIYPTPPFPVYKSHRNLGKIFSHKRKIFHSTPTFDADQRVPFSTYKFNRPRRRGNFFRIDPTTPIVGTPPIYQTCPSHPPRTLTLQPIVGTPPIDQTCPSHPPRTLTLRSSDYTCSNSRCIVCPRLSRDKYITSNHTGTSFQLDRNLHCLTEGVVYALECTLCRKQYVGQTERHMRYRFAAHRYKFKTTPMSLYSHFLRYHACPSLNVTIYLLQQVSDNTNRLLVEDEWIHRLHTILPIGLNNPP